MANLVMQRCMVELLERTWHIKKALNSLYRLELRALSYAILFTVVSGSRTAGSLHGGSIRTHLAYQYEYRYQN